MQRATRTARQTCLLSESFQRHPSCRRLPHCRPHSPPKSIRQLSTSRQVATPLPIFGFLHPPVVRDAVRNARRVERQARGYRKPSIENSFIPSNEGWSESEVERQEDLYRDQETNETTQDAVDRIFGEVDAIPENRDYNRQGLHSPDWKLQQNLHPLLDSPVARLLQSRTKPPEEIIDTHHEELSVERQSALNALRAIIRGMMEGRQEQAASIYVANDLEEYLTKSDKAHFAHYLYQSQHRKDLEELVNLFPDSDLMVPTLCRLERLEEARILALDSLNGHDDVDENSSKLKVLVVMYEYSKRGDWQSLIDMWEDAVMSPTVQSAAFIIRSQQRNFVLEYCLSRIPDISNWYIAKTSALLQNPDTPPKMVQFIKILGAMIIKGLSMSQQEVDGLTLLRYQIETFREIDQNALFWEMRALRLNGRPKAAVEIYLSYRNNEFGTIDHPRDRDASIGRDIKLFIQNEAMASASLLNNFPILKQMFEDIYTLGLEPDTYSYAIIMHAFARHGQAQTVQELFDTFKASGRRPDIYIYAELLYVQVVLLDIPAVEKTFQEIAAAGLDPGKDVYDMLTMAYSRTLDVDGAMRVFRAFIKSGNTPNVNIIGHLISMFASRSDTEAAVEMFNLIGEFGLSPDRASFNQLLNAYAVAGDRINAEAVVSKMRQVGIKPDIVTWTTLLKLYVARKELSAMVDVFARMRRGGVEPNDYAWLQVMTAMADAGGMHTVLNCRRIMVKMANLGIKPNVFHWNALLSAIIASNGNLKEMQELYDSMLEENIKPNYLTHALLVSAYCKLGGSQGVEIAEGILSRLSSIHNHLDLTSRQAPRTALSPALFAPLFKAQGPKIPLDSVQDVFDGYIQSTASVGGSVAEPDLGMLTALLEVYGVHRDLNAVKRVWKAIKSHADHASRSFRSTTEESTEFVVPGNRYLLCTPFSVSMRALADGGELDEIDSIWDQLGQEGYDFNCENWNTRIKICLKHKKHIVWAFRACEEVLMDGWEEKLRAKRRKIRNPPEWIRARRKDKMIRDVIKRTVWPVEDDLMDLEPLEPKKESPELELWVYHSTLYEFILLRRDLLLGTSIIDSSGHQRPGPEVWERLKQAFPRIVRAMLLHLRRFSEEEWQRITVDFEHDVRPKGKSRQVVDSQYSEPRSLMARSSFI